MAVDPTSGQLGSAALGSFGLGWPGPLSIQQARINSFTASNYGPVVPGIAITLTWSTTFATTVSISGIGIVAANGSMVVNPSVTTTYILTASDGVNPTQTRSLTITVTTPAVRVRSAKAGPTFGSSISLTMQVNVGDLVNVFAGNGIQFTNTQDMAIPGNVDSLGNTYAVAIQGNGLPPEGGPAQDAMIAYSFIAHAGMATITVNCTQACVLTLIVTEHTPPPGMALSQIAHEIGGITVAPPSGALGTAPYNYANSLILTFGRIGGQCVTTTSLDGDTLVETISGCAQFQSTAAAVFEAIVAGPGIRNSKVEFSPFFPGFDDCGGVCPGPPYSIGGVQNCLVVVYSAPLPRPTSPAPLTDQAAVRPALSSIIGVYNGQPDVDVSFGFMPKVGSLIFVGASAGNSGGPPISTFTPTDAYGNTYHLLTSYSGQTSASHAMFYSVVQFVPASGVFTVNVAFSVFNFQHAAQISNHDILNLNPATILTAIQNVVPLGTGQSLLTTNTFSTTVRTLISGFGYADRFNNVPTPWLPSGGFGIDASWDTGQVDATPLANAPRTGTSDWFHKYVPNPGTFDGETITDSGAQSLSNSGIIVAYVSAPVIPSGGPVTLTCAVNGGTGVVGVFYSAQVIASGGTPPYSNYHLVQGSGPFPPGLTLHSATGVIDGIPTLAGTYTFTIEVTDSLGATATVTCTIRIQSSFPIACPGVSTGNVGVFFSSQLTASGGTPPYTWVLVAGTLPPGLTLAPSGLISGIPTTAGSYTYTVQATDSSGTPLQAQQVCMIIIGPALCYLPLWRQDEFAMDAFLTSWAQAPATRPRAFSVSVTPPVSLQVAPVPLNSGVLDLCVVEGGPVLDPGDLTTLLAVADDLAWVVVFGALSDLLSQDGQSRDPSRAAYCESRYQQAIEVARQLPSGLTTQVNNIPMNTGSVFDLDAFLPNWQCVQGRPRYGGYAGRNLLALGPVPDGVYGITADIVPNIPVPVADVDFIQAGREDIAYILDYAQHLASFKMGGAEFTNTMKLLKNFFAGAVMRNSRLKGTTIDKFDLDVPGSKQQLQYERTEGGSSMPTTNEGS